MLCNANWHLSFHRQAKLVFTDLLRIRKVLWINLLLKKLTGQRWLSWDC